MAIADWWTFPMIDLFGQAPDPEGPFPKPDVNISAPAGTLFTAPLPGTVSGIDFNSPFGDVITINLDNPINGSATHYAFLHLSNIAPLNVGQHVTAGEVLGVGGGGQSKSGASPGFAFTPSSMYGFGSGWANNVHNVGSKGGAWINPQLDPTNFLHQLSGQNLVSGIKGSASGNCCNGDLGCEICMNTIGLTAPSVICCPGVAQKGAVGTAISGLQIAGLPTTTAGWTQVGFVVVGILIVLIAFILIFKGGN